MYSRYGEGSGPVWLNHVICQGSEVTILDCLHDDWGVNDCNHMSDVSISCGIAFTYFNHFKCRPEPMHFLYTTSEQHVISSSNISLY